jgi:hypothetical protein
LLLLQFKPSSPPLVNHAIVAFPSANVPDMR